MFTSKKILAVLDPNLKEQTSLLHAISVAHKTGANIVALTCIYDKSYDMAAVLTSDQRFNMKQAMLEHEKLKVEALVKSLGAKACIEVVIDWQKKMHESVIDICKEYQCDLIIKATKEHGLFASSLFTPSDWHILRQSAVDVLLVKTKAWPQSPKIVASIGVSAKDDMHICLSDKVAKTAANLAESFGAEVHFANAFAGAPIHVAVEVPNFSPQDYNQAVHERHHRKLKELGETYSVDQNNIHVLEGLPEDILPELCEKLNANLLVIGSIGRTGISAAFLGNTAELIIDAVNCDTLVVKPD